ncbi:S8 family serine peptidase [Arthrobacter sp. NEB 688]|uniref:S53 family peptidase n=1 Tax=Arthrobacter sp. NEB 688 TaxID=904039 RepID=UPI001563AF5D|nr:S8 family serine peptidase [Arthrobacter sp. NEB 688]QKE82997.1 S8 family serine peptidase [Arthrobacter sp. NEB 688]
MTLQRTRSPHRAARRLLRTTGTLVAAAVVGATLVAAPTSAAPVTSSPSGSDPTLTAPAVVENACATARPGQVRCLAKGRVDRIARQAGWSATASTDRLGAAARTSPLATAATRPPGYGADQLRAAYRLPATGSTATVAVLIAGDVPHAEADLAVYRATYKLPPCRSSTGCFRKVNQQGRAKPLPPGDPGWALEGSMDVQMVSAACPTCRILLVTADDPSLENLAAATETARRLGASVASHSYGADESAFVLPVRSAYRSERMISVVSSGDFGFTTASFPAALPNVIAVGGTSLRRSTSARGWNERVWDFAGSACSAWFAKPAAQKDRNCAMRTVSDISAVADPQTGVAVYDTWENPFGPDWVVLGGTSASAPLVAGMVGAARAGRTLRTNALYGRTAFVNDVVGGTNGFCGGDYLCKGVVGYDAPSGIGTPRGLRVFTG